MRALATAVLVCLQLFVATEKGSIYLFPPAFVNSQIAQVDRLRVFHQMIFGSSLLCAGVVKVSRDTFHFP